MRRNNATAALFPPIRAAILAATIMQPDRWWYLSDLARHLRLTPSSLQREIARLKRGGILRDRRDGNRVYYQPDPECPFMADLRGLIVKTSGLVDVVRQALAPLEDRLDCAFVYGSVATATQTSTSDVDLIVVGDVGLADLAIPIRSAQDRISRVINTTVYSPDELARKLANGHHFLEAILEREKIFVLGSQDALDQVARREASPTRAGQKARA